MTFGKNMVDWIKKYVKESKIDDDLTQWFIDLPVEDKVEIYKFYSELK